MVDDAIEQGVEVKSGGDQIRGPLQRHEGLNELAGGIDTRWDSASSLTDRCEGAIDALVKPSVGVTKQMCERELRCNLLRTEHSPKDSSDPIQRAAVVNGAVPPR